MKRLLIAAAVLFVPFATFAETTSRYIVMTKMPAKQALESIGEEIDPAVAEHAETFESINGFVADLTWSQMMALRRSKNVLLIEPDLERHKVNVAAESDSITPGQETTPYGVTMVNAPQVWSVTRGQSLDPKKPVHVAIADTGIFYKDPEFRFAYKGGHDFVNNTDDPLDDEGHGTHVAGTIAAADDGRGVVGVAPDVDIYSLKVLNSCGSGFSSGNIHAVDWVIEKKAEIGGNWIMNFSLGSTLPSTPEQAAFQRAADAGILVFAAAGNDSDPSNLIYPGGYSTVVSVGAIDSTKTIASFSNGGPDLKVVAPGVAVLSTFLTEKVVTNDGRTYPATLAAAETSGGGAFCLPYPQLTSTFVDSGRGNPADFPPSVKGKIAFIERGDLTFATKVANAKAAGAIGVILYNSDTGAVGIAPDLGTVNAASDVLPTAYLERADGLALKATPGATVTLSFGYDTFALLNGTSMATPHAVGTAALVWACAPNATATDVANAMEQTATDLGTPGFDNVYGYGLINAAAAVKMLTPSLVLQGGKPLAPPFTGRAPGRRGH